jgi:hypothetical protein
MTHHVITQTDSFEHPQPQTPSAYPVLCHAHLGTTHVKTTVAAHLLLVEPQTLLKSHSQKGCYGPIRPIRLPSRRLAWPLAEIEKLLNTPIVTETTREPYS